jgi:hypothetical protein
MISSEPGGKTVAIDFLYLDLEVCERCRGTDANLDAALATVGSVLESAGAKVRVTKTLVDSEQKARALGFLSSPTIRVNGRDVALEFRESRCESEACACADGSGSAIDCRVWVYQGKQHTAAPVPMIVDAILSGVYAGATAKAAPAGDVPENLLRLFRSRARREEAACCDASRQESCCGQSQKASCCGPRREADAGACGCQ